MRTRRRSLSCSARFSFNVSMCWQGACISTLIGWAEDKTSGTFEDWLALCQKLAAKWGMDEPEAPADAEWIKTGRTGRPSSSRAPSQTRKTPDRAPLFVVPENSPEKVVHPMRKVQLTAEKRMQQQLKVQANGSAKGKAKEPAPKDKTPKKQSKAEAKAKAKAKAPKEQSKAEAKAKAKTTAKTRKKHDGPMKEAMDAFFAAQKEAGVPWKDARQAWLKSDERSEIIATMGEAERKRRRF